MFERIKKFMLGGEKEREVIERFREHISLIAEASEIFKTAIEKGDRDIVPEVCEIERYGDALRRETLLKLFEGAFIPVLRPNFYKLAESIDNVLDELEDVAVLYLMIGDISDDLLPDLVRVAEINVRMGKLLLKAFESLEKNSEIEDILLKIKISEEEVDSIKSRIYRKIKLLKFENFAEWYLFIRFIEKLLNISDLIEDSADIIQILNVSLR